MISLVMLRGNTFGKVTANIGAVAGVLLLIGNFTVGYDSSGTIAIVVVTRYVLLSVWLFLAAHALYGRAQGYD